MHACINAISESDAWEFKVETVMTFQCVFFSVVHPLKFQRSGGCLHLSIICSRFTSRSAFNLVQLKLFLLLSNAFKT